MKKILVFAMFAMATQLPAQNIFNPLSQLLLPGGSTNPQTAAGNANSPTIALGGAIGGLLGNKSQKSAEGTAIGSALGLIFGQMLGGNPQSANGANLPQGLGNANLPQIDPATGLPVDPNAAGGNAPPMIDPTTGLPVAGPGRLGIPNGGAPTARLKRQRAVNKLFGR